MPASAGAARSSTALRTGRSRRLEVAGARRVTSKASIRTGLRMTSQDRVNGQLERAESLARRLHSEQFDKSGAPYSEHCRRVAAKLGETQSKTVAWLHDVLEDTEMDEGALRAQFDGAGSACIHQPSQYHSCRSGDHGSEYRLRDLCAGAMRAGLEMAAVDRKHRTLRSKSKSTYQVHRRNAGFSRLAKPRWSNGLDRENHWWRRRELNPRPKAVVAWLLHA
jgi:hypothetical protein